MKSSSIIYFVTAKPVYNIARTNSTIVCVFVAERFVLGVKEMFKLSLFLTISTAVCLLLSACGGNASSSGGKTVVVTPAIKGNSASLNVGDTLEIQIPTIPTVGFEWEAQDLDTTILLQEGSAVYTEDPGPNSAGGMVTLVFTAIGVGRTTLNLEYVSSSATESPGMSTNSFGMVVEVK
jgi:predicted secreted protein